MPLDLLLSIVSSLVSKTSHEACISRELVYVFAKLYAVEIISSMPVD